MKTNMIKMLIGVAILFGIVFGYKAIHKIFMMRYMASHGLGVTYVSTAKAVFTKWQPQFTAAGNLRAILGVNVTTELAGMIRSIYFIPGAIVHQGDLLVQLNIDPDVAALHRLEASQALAEITYRRDKAQYDIAAISKAVLDTDEANLKSAIAAVEQQKAIIEQKTIHAPFSGKLGISLVNPGQYLNPGDKITLLQAWDPIYVDFYAPQQWVEKIKVGQRVTLKVNAYPKELFVGTITAMDPAVDSNVRNVQIEATLPNASLQLVPGMFTVVTVDTGKAADRLTVPEAALSFNPYGATVYIVKEKGEDTKGRPILTANQVFVKTGEQRGDQIEILSGLASGETVVTSGQLKLRNGARIAINNTVLPTNEENPKPIDD
ncbi:MAG: hypothetical protein ACD_21C00177G0002 [uncultured bacterium]|nr:MAG: hypothetical protein ACD_21C00177G0002 [uncultured bacterium]